MRDKLEQIDIDILVYIDDITYANNEFSIYFNAELEKSEIFGKYCSTIFEICRDLETTFSIFY